MPKRRALKKTLPYWIDEFRSVGGKVDAKGRVKLYHATTGRLAERILAEGVLRRPRSTPDSYGVYASSSPEVAADYGDGTVVEITVPVWDLHPDDIFPGRRMDFRIETHGGMYIPINVTEVQENPAGKYVFDTANPPPDADHVLAFAAVYNERKHTLEAWHVTNDAKRTMDAVRQGVPLIEMGHAGQELGPGLYASAIPQIWMGRATDKWSFLETLTDEERERLTDALAAIVLRQVQDHYITESEYKTANRDLGYFVETGGPGFALTVAGQPYNISFWKPDFLEPLGIKPGKTPEVVKLTIKGIFAGFDDMPTHDELEELAEAGMDGCFLRGGLMTTAQMVVWKNKAIVGMNRVNL